MIKNNLFTILIILFTTTISMYASEKLLLSESDAVLLGQKQNISLKESVLSLNSSQDQVDNNWNNFLPNFNINTGISRSEVFLSDNSSIDPWGMSAYGGLSLTLHFSDFLNIESNELKLKSSQLQYENIENLLKVNIKKQFKYLLASKENLTLQKNNIGLAQKRYDQAIINFNNGLISELALLTAQNSVESLKPALQDTDTTYKQNMMSFKNRLGLKLSEEIELQGVLEVEPFEYDKELLINTYISKRSDVNSEQLNIELQSNQLKKTKADSLLPSISVAANWNNSINTLFDDPDWSDRSTISASISIPVEGYIPGSSNNIAIKNAERSVESKKLSLESTLNNAEEEIRSILMELEGAWANIETTKLSVNLARKTYEMTETAFSKGSSELLDVEDAQNKLLSANQDLVLSKYKYLSSLQDLEYALNTDITILMNK